MLMDVLRISPDMVLDHYVDDTYLWCMIHIVHAYKKFIVMTQYAEINRLIDHVR